MHILWDAAPAALSPGDVQAQLEPKHQVAYTTAMTVLVRLWKKGMLERHKVGRAYQYTPTETRPDYEARRMAEILHSVDDRTKTLSRFFDALTADERGELEELIKDA